MNISYRIITLGIMALHMHDVSAYEIKTHAILSEAAFGQSGLSKDMQLLQNLGLKSSDKFFNSQDPEPRTIKELITDGARFEDNTDTLKRPLNHFFDPLRNQPLRPYGIPLFVNHTSPDWALEDNGPIGKQDYSFRDARDDLYQALTLQSRQEREKKFGLTFQTLGQVIHHVQDMAQPQHVRNDAHLDSPQEFLGFIPNPFYNPSRYEDYTNKNRDKDFIAAYLAPNAYPRVLFPKARDFWHTKDRNPQAGRGIAEFTNQNFVSAGTNFPRSHA